MSEQIPYLPSCIPTPLEEGELKDIVAKAKDWVLLHGIGMRLRTSYSEDCIYQTPFVLLPSTFPRKEFQKSLDIQTTLNELMHRVAHNNEFLTQSLKDAIQVDEFTGNLFKIYETVQREGVNQKVSLGLFRSDYMVHSSRTDRIKQVEFNTFSSSLAGCGTQVSRYNRYVLEELGYHDKLVNIPENKALEGLCQGMLDAWKIYGKPESVILFIVEDVTYNICDQRFHEFEIRKMDHRARVIRRNLTQVEAGGKLNSENELVIDDTYIVSVVYYRSGYEPGQYHTKKEWDARLLMERSMAIKCPSIQYHLAGTKKVQQILAKPGVLEEFVTDSRKIEAIRDIFTGLYGLDYDEAGDQAVQMALDDPERFVLKPQREGGGNNIYGQEIKDAILNMKDTKERSAWILMERIKPPISKGYIIRPGGSNPPPVVEMVSELGIFGITIGDSDKLLINRQAGHMLRTKVATANEGGVAAGVGALDSPYLID